MAPPSCYYRNPSTITSSHGHLARCRCQLCSALTATSGCLLYYQWSLLECRALPAPSPHGPLTFRTAKAHKSTQCASMQWLSVKWPLTFTDQVEADSCHPWTHSNSQIHLFSLINTRHNNKTITSQKRTIKMNQKKTITLDDTGSLETWVVSIKTHNNINYKFKKKIKTARNRCCLMPLLPTVISHGSGEREWRA